MAKSLLHMISNDIGQLACLYAKLHCLDRVYFGGFFIRGHPVTMRTITYSINFFSKVLDCHFLPLRHPGLPSSQILGVGTSVLDACQWRGAGGPRAGSPAAGDHTPTSLLWLVPTSCTRVPWPSLSWA